MADAATGTKRGRQHLRLPGDEPRCLGIAPEPVGDVVLTHLHHDHCGNQRLFAGERHFPAVPGAEGIAVPLH